MAEDWITTAEAAQVSGYHVEYIRQLARDEAIMAKKWARDWMISRSSLLEYMDKLKTQGKRRGPKPSKIC